MSESDWWHSMMYTCVGAL